MGFIVAFEADGRIALSDFVQCGSDFRPRRSWRHDDRIGHDRFQTPALLGYHQRRCQY